MKVNGVVKNCRLMLKIVFFIELWGLEHQPKLELKYDVVKKFIKIRGLATRAAD
jgi:hypothetical protein